MIKTVLWGESLMTGNKLSPQHIRLLCPGIFFEAPSHRSLRLQLRNLYTSSSGRHHLQLFSPCRNLETPKFSHKAVRSSRKMICGMLRLVAFKVGSGRDIAMLGKGLMSWSLLLSHTSGSHWIASMVWRLECWARIWEEVQIHTVPQEVTPWATQNVPSLTSLTLTAVKKNRRWLCGPPTGEKQWGLNEVNKINCSIA